MTVLIAEGMHEKGWAVLKDAQCEIVTPQDRFDRDAVEVIIVRSVFQVDAQTRETYPNVRIIAKLGTGLDNIDLAYCEETGIQVISAPSMNAVSTAEFAVMQMINVFKNAYEIYDRVKDRDYRRHLYFGRECAQQTVGVIGYGSVGRHIVKLLTPLVKKIYVRDNNMDGSVTEENRCFVPDIHAVLPECGAVILAVTLKQNAGMINRAFLSRLRDDAVLINIARGKLIDEGALTDYLRRHPKAVYCCDVLSEEPDYFQPPESQADRNELLTLTNVRFSPHIAGMTDECQAQIAAYVADQVVAALRQEEQQAVSKE